MLTRVPVAGVVVRLAAAPRLQAAAAGAAMVLERAAAALHVVEQALLLSLCLQRSTLQRDAVPEREHPRRRQAEGSR